MLQRFKLFAEQKNIRIQRERPVQGGMQLSLTDGKDIVHCTFYANGTIFPQGSKNELLDLIIAWAGRRIEKPSNLGDLTWADFPASWGEWDEESKWLSGYISRNGVPDESDATDEYKIRREVMFHDYMFRMQLGATISSSKFVFVLHNWFNRFCFMGLDVERLTIDILETAKQYVFDDEELEIGAIANAISFEMCNYCLGKFIKYKNEAWLCPQVMSDQNGCASALIDAAYPYSQAGSVLAYTKGNFEKLLKRNSDVRWHELKLTTPLEESMAKGLNSVGLLYIPQYQAYDQEHRYKIDFVIKTTNNLMIAVECDGLQFHARPDVYIRDRVRDRYLQQRGFYVMRFSSGEIFNNLDLCLKEIDQTFWYLQKGEMTLKTPPRNSYFGVHE